MENLTPEQKKKLKDILKDLSTEDEKVFMGLLDKIETSNKLLQDLLNKPQDTKSIETGLAKIVESIKVSSESLPNSLKELNTSLDTFYKETRTSLDGIKTVAQPAEYVKLLNDVVLKLSGVESGVKAWRWPQYMQVGLRDKSFANINPRIEDGHGSTAANPTYVTGTGTGGSSNVNIHDAAGNSLTSTGGKLDVNATLVVGDIEIGAVELKNGTDDTRATVTAANALKVDGSAVTQPVSGTVTANQGTANATEKWRVNVIDALPAGTNVIGHVIADTGSTTAVTGNVTVVQPTGTNLHVVVDSGSITTGGLTQTQLETELDEKFGDLGQKTMAGSAPVVLASDQASIPVAATLTAETTKVIGTVNQGTSPWVVGTHGVTQSTSPWIVAGGGTAGTAATGVVTIQGIASMTKLLVTPDSVALPANQSVNVSQINAVTPLMGNGVTGTGSQRVTIASDNTPFPIKIDQTTPGTTNAVSLAQIGATTVSTGNGVAGAGVQRVTIASDNTTFPVTATLGAGTAAIGDVNQTLKIDGVQTAVKSYSGQSTTNATTTVSSSTLWVASIAIIVRTGGTTSTLSIRDKQATPLAIVNNFATTTALTTPTIITPVYPFKLTSGLDIITAGAVAATVDIFITYLQ